MRISRFARRFGIILAVSAAAAVGVGAQYASADPVLTSPHGVGAVIGGTVTTGNGGSSITCTAGGTGYTFSALEIALVDPAVGFAGVFNTVGVAGGTNATDDPGAWDPVGLPANGVLCPNGTGDLISDTGNINSAASPFSCSGSGIRCEMYGDYARLGGLVLVDTVGCFDNGVGTTCDAATDADANRNAAAIAVLHISPNPTGLCTDIGVPRACDPPGTLPVGNNTWNLNGPFLTFADDHSAE